MLGVDRNAVPPDPYSATSAVRGRRRQAKSIGQGPFSDNAINYQLAVCWLILQGANRHYQRPWQSTVISMSKEVHKSSLDIPSGNR